MNHYLLDPLPGFTWWGGFGITIIIGIISFLFKTALASEKEKREGIEDDIKELQKEDAALREKLNDINLTFVGQINSILIRLAEFKRDLTK